MSTFSQRLPLIVYTAKKDFMGQFVNRRLTTYLALLIGTVIVVLNAALVYVIVAPLSAYLQAMILGGYAAYHLYLVYAMRRDILTTNFTERLQGLFGHKREYQRRG